MPAMRADLAEAASLTRVPLGIRNGSWDDATLDPAGGRISSINNAGCHACHARAEAWQYTFSYPSSPWQPRPASRSTAPATDSVAGHALSQGPDRCAGRPTYRLVPVSSGTSAPSRHS